LSRDLREGVHRALSVCAAISNTNFIHAEPGWITSATFTYLMINLKDALMALDHMGERVSFRDEVGIDGDITDLVRELRNAVAHNGSVLRLFDKERELESSFNVIEGAHTLGVINGFEITNPHKDDVAFFVGRMRIYLVRHIRRAIDEGWIALGRCR
jgi:hypothetical protein